MILLRCKLCMGEIDIIGNEKLINKKVKCRRCGFNSEPEQKSPEIIILRKTKSFNG